MKYCTTGDFLIHAPIPEDHEGVKKVIDFIAAADVKITNLETTVTDGSCWASAYYCDTALTTRPETLSDFKRFGFQACACCNNHSLDFGPAGLLQTIDFLDQAGIGHAGTGRNMDEASAPAIIDTDEGKVAYIALGAMCLENESGRAGFSHDGIPARPGVNCLRHIDESLVTQEQMDKIKALARETMVNAAEDLELTGPEIVEKRLEKSTASMETGQIFYLSVVPQWTMENGKITSMKMLPVELGLREPMGRKGIPSPCSPQMVFDELQRVCNPYGTELKISGDYIELVL